MLIRLSTAEDALDMQDIYNFYVKNSVFTFDLHTPELSQIQDSISNSHVHIVMEKDNELVAYAYAGLYRKKSAYDWACEIGLYVKQSQIGKGLGYHIYACLIAILKEMGYRTLLAGITIPNPQSVSFHRKFGFEKLYTIDKIGFKKNEWLSVDWYRLNILPFEEKPETVKTINDLDQNRLNDLFKKFSK